MNSTKIETIAIGEVERCFERCETILVGLNKNEKTIAWDGLLCMYNDINCTVESLYGKLPVQVKGRTFLSEHKDEIDFCIEKKDLKAYQDDGIIYFVVYINRDIKTVYYLLLAPINIKGLIEKCGNHKSVFVKLNKWAYSDSNDIEKDLRLFYDDCKRQKSYIDSPIISFNDLNGLNKVQLKVFSYMSKTDNISRNFVNQESFVYAKIGDNPINSLIPIGTGRYSFVVTETVYKKISIDNKVYFDHHLIIRDKNNDIISIGDCLKLTMSVKDSQKISININFDIKKYTLSEAINVLDFIFSLISYKHVLIDDNAIDLTTLSNKDNEELNRFNELNGLYNRLIKLKAALDALYVKEDLNMCLITNKSDERLIDVLIMAFYNHECVTESLDLNYLTEIKLGNICELLTATRTDNNTYKLENYFHSNQVVRGKFTDDVEYIVPPYAILDKNYILKYSNIDYENILESFKENALINTRCYELANWMILNLLLAYDEQKTKNELIIKTALDMVSWLIDSDTNDQNQMIYYLNKLQIKKRLGQIEEPDKEYLFNLIENTKSADIKFATYLLLDNQEFAARFFEKMDNVTQNKYKKMPIYCFVNDKFKS